MRKILLSTALLLLVAGPSFAQVGKTEEVKKSLSTTNKDTVAWVHSGLLTIGANQGLLHNWAAGGEIASLDINAVFHGNLTYFHHSGVWTNDLDLAYGLHYGYADTFLPHKTADRIDFTSKYGQKLKNSKDFYFAGLFNFKSQFTEGYDYTVPNWWTQSSSHFLSPAYLTLALGMEYRRGEDLSLFLSPIAAREILSSIYYTRRSKEGAFGIDSGKTSKFQFGAYFSGRYKRQFTKAVLFTTRLDLFSNYLAKNTTDAAGNIIKKDDPGNIQVFWDNLFVFKTYKSLSLTLGLTFAYDNNFPYSKTYIDKTTGAVVNKKQPLESLGWVQLDEVFTLGVSYKF